MSELDQQVEQIELSMEQAKKLIDRRDDMLKLINNDLFKKLIYEAYFKEEAHRLVLLKSEPNMQEEKDQRDIDKQIIAIGELWQWIRNVMRIGDMADRDIKEHELAKEEILAEAID